jgi:hypothetical protein
MNKQQSQAFASVLCRVVDYWHTRATAEQDAQTAHVGSPVAERIIAGLKESESRVAQALEAVNLDAEDESGEPHHVG